MDNCSMKYKLIIQEMKESKDLNVRAFVRDMEKLKPLTKKERDFYLQNRYNPVAKEKLIADFIPYIIMVAYAHSEKTKNLSVLDLINEGILGAYTAYEKHEKKGETLTKRRVCEWIKKNIRKAIYNANSKNSMDVYNECLMDDDQMGEESIIDDVNGKWLRQYLTELIMDQMNKRNGRIIIEYYLGGNDDLKKIGDKYGISHERVRQIINNFAPLYRKLENIKLLREL